MNTLDTLGDVIGVDIWGQLTGWLTGGGGTGTGTTGFGDTGIGAPGTR